jgi:threonine dehydrogenase-like Zn-dependent dehydrogenase
MRALCWHGKGDVRVDTVPDPKLQHPRDAIIKITAIKTGRTHVQAYTKPLLVKIVEGEIDPSFVVTHPASLEDAPEMYKKFRDKEAGVIKVVMRPGR